MGLRKRRPGNKLSGKTRLLLLFKNKNTVFKWRTHFTWGFQPSMSVIVPKDMFVWFVCLFINDKRMFVQATRMTKEMGRGATQLAGVSVWLPTKLWHHLVGKPGFQHVPASGFLFGCNFQGSGHFPPTLEKECRLETRDRSSLEAHSRHRGHSMFVVGCLIGIVHDIKLRE